MHTRALGCIGLHRAASVSRYVQPGSLAGTLARMLGHLFWYVLDIAEQMRPDGPLICKWVPTGLYLSSPRRSRWVLIVEFVT
jgi:hypothetical protein